MSEELEYRIVCGLAVKKLSEDYANIISKVDLSGEQNFIKTPPEMHKMAMRIIRDAKAIEHICVIKHPNISSNAINIITEQIIKTFELE